MSNVRYIILLAKAFFIVIFFLLSSIQTPAQTAKAKLYISIKADCPITKYYLPLLVSEFESEEYEKIDIYLLSVSKLKKFDELKLIKKIKRLHKNINFIYDVNLRQHKSLDLRIAPEVLVLNENGKECYRGAIDDKYFQVGSYQQQTTQYYMRDAVMNLIKKECIGNVVPASGCVLY